RRFREDPARVAVAGPCRYVGGPWWGRVYAGILFDLVHLVYRATGRVMYVTATNIAFRKDAWSGYDLTGTQGADELRLLRQLRTRGRVAFDRANPTFTSARRLARGLVYNVAVSFLFYYALAVMLNRVAGRPLIGTAPAFRSHTVERWKFGPRAQRIRARAVGLAWLAAIVAGAITAAGLVENTWLAKR
ncbi:MAG TPA: hypothetical protein VG497_03525, partial [Kribbella sp.]|nr:hypothetical protein [Kribbella sp.]